MYSKKLLNRAFCTLLIALTLIFAACEGPAGPAGTDGTDGINGTNGTDGTNGTNGTPGGGGISVYDSSTTPQFVGYLLSYSNSPIIILTSTGYIVNLNSDGTLSNSSYVFFTQQNGTGDKLVDTPFVSSKRCYYHATIDAANFFLTDGTTVNGHQSRIPGSSPTVSNYSDTGTYLKVTSTISTTAVGLPASITGPLVFVGGGE